jgi:hypothetical protein
LVSARAERTLLASSSACLRSSTVRSGALLNINRLVYIAASAPTNPAYRRHLPTSSRYSLGRQTCIGPASRDQIRTFHARLNRLVAPPERGKQFPGWRAGTYQPKRYIDPTSPQYRAAVSYRTAALARSNLDLAGLRQTAFQEVRSTLDLVTLAVTTGRRCCCRVSL